jgi:hybrid cluster-associated redox disulfide protein
MTGKIAIEEASMEQVTKDMLIGDIIREDFGIVEILAEAGMHCAGCPAAQSETLEEACMVHGMDADVLTEKINAYINGAQ